VKPVEKTRDVVASVLRVPAETLDPDTILSEIGPLDSLSLAEIASALDDAFGVRLPSEDLTTGQSVADLAALVERAPRR